MCVCWHELAMNMNIAGWPDLVEKPDKLSGQSFGPFAGSYLFL